MWINAKSGHFFYPALIFRNHFFDGDNFKRIMRSNYSAIALFLCIILSLFFAESILYLLSMYSLIVSGRFFLKPVKKMDDDGVLYFLERIFNQIAQDFCFVIGFFLFFPTKKKIMYRKYV
jgi:hypothetical protein